MPSNVYTPSSTAIGLVIVAQLGVCILLLGGVMNGVHGHDTLIGLSSQIIGIAIALGALLPLMMRRRLGLEA